MYTFVLDLDRGTYVSQVSNTLRGAWLEWLRTDAQKIEVLSEAGSKKLIKSVSDDEPSVVEGVENVWCLSGPVEDGLAMLHIVKTGRHAIQNPKSKI
jgi:hypothetical protein